MKQFCIFEINYKDCFSALAMTNSINAFIEWTHNYFSIILLQNFLYYKLSYATLDNFE